VQGSEHALDKGAFRYDGDQLASSAAGLGSGLGFRLLQDASCFGLEPGLDAWV